MASSNTTAIHTLDDPFDRASRVASIGALEITTKPSVYTATLVEGTSTNTKKNFIWQSQGWSAFMDKHRELMADQSTNWCLSSINASLDDKDITGYAGVWTHAATRNNKVERYEFWEDFSAQFERNKSSMRLIDFDIHAERGYRYFAATWGGQPTEQQFVHDVDWITFIDQWNNLSNTGWRLKRVRLYPAYKTWKMTGLFEKGQGDQFDKTLAPWYTIHRFDSFQAFLDMHNSLERLGRPGSYIRLRDFQVYDDYPTGNRYYVGVWLETASKPTAIFAKDWATLNTEIEAKFSSAKMEVCAITRYAAQIQAIKPQWVNVFNREFAQSYGYAAGYWVPKIATGGNVSGFARARQDWPANPPTPINPTEKPQAFQFTTRMNLASVSKPLAAVALLKLFADKKKETGDNMYDIETPFYHFVQNYIHPVGQNVQKIKIRHLLQHRSGLAGNDDLDFPSIWDYLKGHLQKNINDADIGVNREYSNLNFTVIQAVIDCVAGHGGEVPDYFETYVTTNILKPMDIDTTIFNSNPDPLPDRTLGYGNKLDETDTRNGVTFGKCDGLAAAGWISDSIQLSKFLKGVVEMRVLDQATTELMFKNGLGWRPLESLFGQYYVHGGHFGTGGVKELGISAGIVVFPIGGGAVLLVNQEKRDPPGAIVWALEDRSEA